MTVQQRGKPDSTASLSKQLFLSLPPFFHLCHNSSMFATPSPLLFVSLSSLNPHFLRHELCLSVSLRGRGEKETPEMSNLNEATTYATTAGQTPYLVLFCGCRVRALLWGTQKFDWCCLSKTKTLERNLYSLFTAFMKPEPLGRIINNSKGLLEVLKQLRSYLIQRSQREQKIRIKKNICFEFVLTKHLFLNFTVY